MMHGESSGPNEGSSAARDRACSVADAKTRLRADFAVRRGRRDAASLDQAAGLLAARLSSCEARIIAAFVPTRSEPGNLAILDAALAEGREVLLPVIGRRGQPLSWARYRGAETLIRGPFGVRQPCDADGSSLTEADLVLVPAVAVALDGTRLGRGGGFYDRSLAGIDRRCLVAVVHDDELVDALPSDPHDIKVGWACTPSRMVRLR